MFRVPAIVLTICVFAWFGHSNVTSGADEVVTIYPTYGYQDTNGWVIPVRLWVHERRSVADAVARKLVASLDGVSRKEIINFQSRAADFLADSESREDIALAFAHDPLQEPFHLVDSEGRTQKSDLNGLIEGTLTLSRERADSLLKAQASPNGWLSLDVVSKGHSGTGRVRLIAPEGISVISDIDDTIKVTEIPAGPTVVMQNTFLRDYRTAPGMREKYSEWSDAAFHYISAGPWQMYGPLSEFLIDSNGGFPEGSFHMMSVRTNLLSTSSWRDLTDLITNSEQTFDHKVAQISVIMERFPQRQFILVGDSGEKDPEVYRAILAMFPEQVQEIWIRDIVNDRELNADRLAGIHIIPAANIERGVSEFDK